jgi:YD repeat-containing protein
MSIHAVMIETDALWPFDGEACRCVDRVRSGVVMVSVRIDASGDDVAGRRWHQRFWTAAILFLLFPLVPLLPAIATPAYALGTIATLFTSADAPDHPDVPTTSVEEFGTVFSSDADGVVRGVRYYRGPNNTGPHTGSIWTNTGTRLATAAFVNEADSGWETALFAQPVAITAGAQYVASYVAPSGHYSYTAGQFTAAYDRAPLHVPASGGRFLVGGGFPTTVSTDNYNVDVLFESGVLVVTSASPTNNDRYVPTTVHPTVTFNTAITSGSLAMSLTGPSGAVSGSTGYNTTTRTATFTPSAALTVGRTYTVSVNAQAGPAPILSPYAWSFTVAGPPVANTIFASTELPQVASVGSTDDTEVGVRFMPVADGTVSGVRFYKGPANTGSHVGSLWSADGSLLASATFTGESSSGWQSVNFPQSVPVLAGQTYVASYRAPNGGYATTDNQFAVDRDTFPYHIVAGSGVTHAGAGFPATAGNTNYWVDVTLQTDAVRGTTATNPAAVVKTVTTPGPTSLSGNVTISTDTVWGPQGSPYLILSGLDVPAGVSLTLLPGTVVKIGQSLSVEGQLLSLGTPSSHVTITSLRDDTAMGDTNQDGSATVPAPGDWYRLSFSSSSTNVVPMSALDYTDVRYGGKTNSTTGLCNVDGMVYVTASGRVAIANSTLSYSFTSGLRGEFESSLGSTGLYNSTLSNSPCGVSMTAAKAQLVGNVIDAGSAGTAVNYANSSGRVWFNTTTSTVSATVTSGPPLPRSTLDIEYNEFLNGAGGGGITDWSNNWWGSDLNTLPACMDPNLVASQHLPVTLVPSSSCPQGQQAVSGQAAGVAPSLSASPSILPQAAREAFAPAYGPVNTYSGALTYSATDLSIEDAGVSVAATRTYRSDKTDAPDAGPGWFTSYSQGISSLGSGVAAMNLDNGGSVPFRTDAAAGYVPAPGVAATYSTGANGTTVSTADQTTYSFDSGGALQTVALGDPGHVLTIARSDGHPSRITGASGRYLDYSRADGHLQTTTDSTGRSVSLSYSDGHLTGVTGVDGQTETYGYDGNGRLATVTTPMGRAKLAVAYDSSGRVAWLEQEGIGRTTFDYDTDHGRTIVTTPDGTRLIQEFDWAGRLLAEHVDNNSSAVGGSGRHVVYDGDGRPVVTVTGVPTQPMTGYGPSAPGVAYNASGDAVLNVDPLGRFTTATYNPRHQPLVEQRSLTATTTTTTTNTYDGSGRLATVTDAMNGVTSFQYNSRGQLTQRTDALGRVQSAVYLDNGDRQSATDESGAVTTYEYDGLGRVTAVTDPLGHRTTATYTSWGATASRTRPGGGVDAMTFNNDRQPDTWTDAVGGVSRVEYDGAGRVQATVAADGGRTTYTYDIQGRPVVVTDPNGHVTQRTYSGEGWLVSTVDAAGALTQYSYDPAGHLVRTTNALGLVTQTVWDRAGAQVGYQLPTGANESYTFDAAGRMTSVKTPRGNTWTTTYDNLDRPTAMTDPLNDISSITYDAVGRTATTTDPMGNVTNYAYNDTARTVTQSDSLGIASVVTTDAVGHVIASQDGAGAVSTIAYNADGLPVRQVQPDGLATVSEYDPAGRLVAVTDTAARRTTFTLDPLGRITATDKPGGAHETFGYDPDGNLISHVDATNGTWTYQYGPTNLLAVASDPMSHSTRHFYDALGEERMRIDPTGVVTSYGYDPAGRPQMLRDSTGANWTTFYDADGNVNRTVDSLALNTFYTYDNAGHHTGTTWNGASFTYTYDKDGRMTKSVDPYVMNWTYDARGRVATQVDALSAKRRSGTTGPTA